MVTLTTVTASYAPMAAKRRVRCDGFPSFLPKEVEKIKDPFARKLASRIERLPVPLTMPHFFTFLLLSCIESSQFLMVFVVISTGFLLKSLIIHLRSLFCFEINGYSKKWCTTFYPFSFYVKLCLFFFLLFQRLNKKKEKF